MTDKKRPKDQGFTLIELIVAMAISLVVMAAIFTTFKSQQDSFVVQTQVSATQQNLRAAMYMITRDIQMAGYYTSFDTKNYSGSDAYNWDPTIAGNETSRPILYGRSNDDASGDVKDGTDLIVIVKASNEDADNQEISSGLGDSVGVNTITLHSNDIDFNEASKTYGVLVKSDLSRAEFFEISSISGNTLTLKNNLEDIYGDGDIIFRADVIIYKVNEDDDLERRNLGNDNNNWQVVAENIENFQVRYHLSDTTTAVDISGDANNVRAIEVALLSRTENIIRGYTDPHTYNMTDETITPNDGFQRRLLCSTIKTRNIGL